MNTRRTAFALIELPAVLFLLALAGFSVALVFRCFSGPAPWYAWVLATLVAPAELVLFCLAGFLLDNLLNQRPKQSAMKRPQ